MMMSLLKTATQAQHRAVEALMPVMHPSLTSLGYARLLCRLQAIVQPLETRLVDLEVPEMFDLPRRLKAPLLSRDLAWFPAVHPVLPVTPALAGVPEALGALYVLEGATLGGQIISRHLHQTLGITPERGGAYFSGYGRSTGQMWQAFSQQMDQVVSAADQGRVVAGARGTFQVFSEMFQGVSA